MKLALIIIGSALASVAIISYLLNLFVRKALKNDNDLLARTLVGLLTLQFILGMLANLFVKIPDTQAYDVWHHLGPIEFHSINALVLVILSVIFLVRAVKNSSSVIIATISLISILIATYSGIAFVLTGQANAYSFIMSMGFIVAFLLYARKGFSNFKASSKLV
ncbi:MAG: hypothetical protein P4L74_04520 [Candidatus Doudnabacteria bacterium]|nr:hypothetical protein [Candidatus Doudnabacteria bacterium]